MIWGLLMTSWGNMKILPWLCRKLPQSITYFDPSLKNVHLDKELKYFASYWRTETYFRLGNYDKAFSDVIQFVTLAGAFKQKKFSLAYCNMGCLP